MTITKIQTRHGAIIRWNDDESRINGVAIEMREAIMEDGVEIASKSLPPRDVLLTDSDALTALGASINTASLATIADLEVALGAAQQAKAEAETARETALEQVAELQAQLAALQPVINGVPQFIKKWQLLAGLRIDGLYTPVMAYINSLPPAVLDLWNGSAGVERSSPFLAAFKSQFGKTEADLDDMFTRYSAITQADVLALG